MNQRAVVEQVNISGFVLAVDKKVFKKKPQILKNHLKITAQNVQIFLERIEINRTINLSSVCNPANAVIKLVRKELKKKLWRLIMSMLHILNHYSTSNHLSTFDIMRKC